MSKIAVVLLTYNRLGYAQTTISSARSNIVTKDHDLEWHVASDGDTDEYLEKLIKDGVNRYTHKFPIVPRVTNSERGGYGKNFNLAMQIAHSDCEYVLPLEDDWELTRELDVDPLITDMEHLHVGCARLGYIGYTQELRGTLRHGKCGHWLQFDPESPEPHVFAGHPRIEARWWSREVEPWPEGLLPGETEFSVAHRKAARRYVAWPLDLVPPSGGLFAHIGTERSY